MGAEGAVEVAPDEAPVKVAGGEAEEEVAEDAEQVRGVVRAAAVEVVVGHVEEDKERDAEIEDAAKPDDVGASAAVTRDGADEAALVTADEEVAHGGDLRGWGERAQQDAPLGSRWMMGGAVLDSMIGKRSDNRELRTIAAGSGVCES